MVYYIRFLKTPRFQKQKPGSISVSALICITTDLGDDFLAQDVNLLVTLSLNDSGKILYQEPLSWKAGRRELPIMLGPFSANISQQTIILGVTATSPQKRSPSPDRLLGNSSLPLVMSAWSAPFGGSPSSVAEKLVERRFGPKDRLGLRIWEETGNSIARHIWDAAVASVVYLQQIVTGDPAVSVPLLQGLLRGERNSPLHVLELGSGCGVVGIALAELLPQCSVVLTDLPEVEEIVTQNIAVAKPADSSELEFRTLDWDEELPSDLCGGSIDLVLVSDCTYNADSLPALVSVLSRLVQMSPEAVILVALKRRHESESIFFDLMQSAGLHNLHLDRKQLPSQHGQTDDIELRCYGRERSVSSSQ
ncbi:protein N-lysine methyltransferase family protein [Aspergillus vadensis CBS 113365]|uniref:Uncharacterized protein n=1 Tax=Aspergillus vadensis (strain CBS 113365 / IMI 142717 / IBT 24658) TaxID=1448311 RepID=A0A319BKQ9_ASPVC|nr:hypothetical protein BO88DRAFT_449672 [Aspergillus vadensis CBS 113365]PYH73806.1 hypothetical protein BO88DRAFT_449672 [Aspergillus vadensis CBS 113365]